MKILMLSRDARGIDQDSSTFLRWKTIAAKGIELRCIVSSFKASDEFCGKVCVKSTGGSYKLLRYWRLWKIAKNWSEDVDLITAQDPFELGLIAWFIGKIRKKPVEIQDHGGFFDDKPNGEPLWLIRKYFAYWLMKRVSAIRTVSPRSFEKLVQYGFGSKTILLPINVDKRFAEAIYRPIPHHILSVSRLIVVKNLSLSLEVFAAYFARHPEARYTIVGDGPEKDLLKMQAVKLRIAHVVDFVGEQDPLPWLEKAACFLFLSQHEGWGIAPVEAATVGVPVVMTETGCATLLKQQGLAFLVEECSITSMTDVVEQAIARGEKSTAKYLEDYTIQYAAHWEEKKKSRILVLVQAVDTKDALMGFFVDWLRAASKEFAEITVLALRTSDILIAKNVRVIPLRKDISSLKIGILLNAWWLSWKWRHEYHGVYVRGDIQYVLGCALLWRILNKRIVLWFAHYKPHKLLNVAAHMAHIVATSVPEACAYSGHKRRIIGQAIDPIIFPFYKKMENKMRVLIFGRVSPAKRIAEAVRELKKMDIPGMEVEIIGKALDDQYRRLILEELRDATNIRWKELDISFAEIPTLFKQYDILLNSTNGSLDKVILEAAFSGVIPIVETSGIKSFLPPLYSFLHTISQEERRIALQKLSDMSQENRQIIAKEIAQSAINHHSITHQLKELVRIFDLSK
ncbi:glycosyltransferase [Candidatus Uhrbacteria bacterium]|nr:glycosyltransferase [Candidatus Uhrbacteria bacterium]